MRKRGGVSQRLYIAYVGLVLLFAISSAASFRSAREVVEQLVHGQARAGIPIDLKDPDYKISYVKPEASAAGIRIGDFLVEVDHQRFKGLSDLYIPFRRAHSGDQMTFQVQRQTSEGMATVDAAVRLVPERLQPVTYRDWLLYLVVLIAMPFVCLAVGFFVVAVRIRDPLAWIVHFVLLGFAHLVGFGGFVLYGYGDWFQPMCIVYHQSLANGWPIAMTLFGLYFPVRLPYDRRWPWA